MKRICTIATIVIALSACSKPKEPEVPQPSAERALRIYVVNYPLEYFAAQLAPTGAEVELPVAAGVDPAFWNPSAAVIGDYQRADLIVLNGAGYARWTRYATLPEERIVVSTDGCGLPLLKRNETVHHRHGPEGAHEHGEVAFTTWLDMRRSACQAATVAKTLMERSPRDQKAIEANLAVLDRKLEELHQELLLLGKSADGRPLLASHPVYRYLADAYGFNLRSVHFEPDEEPSNAAYAELRALVKEHPASLMLWEAEPLASTRAKLRSMGIASVVFDPLSQPPARGDFVSGMQDNAKRLACAMGGEECE